MRYSGIGGQAVIEGVMMKASDQYAVSVRKPDGEIEVKVEKFKSLKDRYAIAGIPVVRGIVAFVESLVMGMKTLNYSASFWEEEEQKADIQKKKDKNKNQEQGRGNDLVMGLVVMLAVVLAVGLFVLLPFFVSELLSKAVPSVQLRGLIEGVIRVALFVIYVKTISCMEDIHRVFMYHGAEHKCINCLENGLELTVDNARKQTTVHKRCGTSFMLVVMFVSILFFMFISVSTLWLRMLLRILLIPVIAGLSYEFIIFAGKTENPVMTILSKPGLWLQSLTTKEPDDAMLEVAISSVEAVFDWKKFLEESVQQPDQEEINQKETGENIEEAASTDEKSELETAGFEVVEVGDEEEDDEILQSLDRYFDDHEKTVTSEEKMTLRQMLERGRLELFRAEVPEPGENAWYLLQSCFSNKDFSYRRNDYFFHQEDEVDEMVQNRFFEAVKKRSQRIPLEYILGYTEFMGLVFEVDENVLIPRQDTELLVETAIPLCDGKRVLDLCTGSGCIGLSIAVAGTPGEVILTDISEKALDTAKKNLLRLQRQYGRFLHTKRGISMICGDLWDPVQGKYDVIVSNPPYIETGVIQELMPEVKDFEPRSALDGGVEGMDFYQRIVERASEYLNQEGMLCLEIGYNQGECVRTLMERHGFSDIKVYKDLAGCDRVVTGKYIDQ